MNHDESILLKERVLWSSTEAQCHLVWFRCGTANSAAPKSSVILPYGTAASLFESLSFFPLCSHSMSELKSSIWSSTQLPAGTHCLAPHSALTAILIRLTFQWGWLVDEGNRWLQKIRSKKMRLTSSERVLFMNTSCFLSCVCLLRGFSAAASRRTWCTHVTGRRTALSTRWRGTAVSTAACRGALPWECPKSVSLPPTLLNVLIWAQFKLCHGWKW